METDMDNIILDNVVGNDYQSFKEYEKDMESFSFADIFK